jgi:hypothetical protein
MTEDELMIGHSTRRTLLKQVTFAGAAAWLGPRPVRAASANGKLRHARFGANGMAWVGCVATRFRWDGPGLQFTNEPRANDLVRREYRKG